VAPPLEIDVATPAAATYSPESVPQSRAEVLWQEIAKLVPIVVQIALAALVIKQFQLESRTFYHVFLLAAVAFPIHAVLPLKYRMAFFTAVSFAGIGLVFGLRDGPMLIGAGLLLVGACHLPVSFAIRIAIVLALGVALALSRAGVGPSVLAPGVWPILGSMFMFRLAVYIHSLKHDPTPPTVARTLSYFFMLPNVCYPLFPVVDYTTYGRTHYDDDPALIYQRGVKWIVRGLVHLLLYRLVYLHFTLNTSDIQSLGDVVQSLLAVFFLYLRVSGQFHLIVGILHLFGFHLPETHRLYFLASSISDYWRRINIYWKDFMMKLVFYPSFFRIRKMGDRTALIVSTLMVFVATWALHSYQWFWLRSEFPVTPQDIIFWGLLGGLVVINTLRETKRGRKRTLGARKRWSSSLAMKTMGTFVLLCVLWSLWSADNLIDWLWMWGKVTNVGVRDVVIVVSVLAVGFAITGVVWDAPVAARKGPVPFYSLPSVQALAVLAVLLILSVPSLQDQAGPRTAGFVRSLQSASLNKSDRAVQQKGYYENLDNRGRLSMQLWNVVEARPRGLMPLSSTKAYRRVRNDFLGYDLTPNTSAEVMGKTLTTNQWGMRDQDYTLEKPPGTMRIAMMGPSFTMGSGVGDNETYDAYLEPQLNANAAPGRQYEVLNFGVAAYSLLHQVRMLDERVYKFHPDVVVLADSRQPDGPVVRHVTHALADGTLGAYPDLAEIVARAGVADYPGKGFPVPTNPLRKTAQALGLKARMPEREVTLRLAEHVDMLIDWGMRHAAEEARAHGAIPVYVDGMLPVDTMIADSPMLRSAREAGFVIIKLSSIFEGLPRNDLRIGSWDNHANEKGMKIIADGLYAEFKRRDAELKLGIVK
jgi:D-alanyl-lipoteichoic acid acyltransferase DltB (MBOAT superfamily)